jgi:hypothetical protein
MNGSTDEALDRVIINFKHMNRQLSIETVRADFQRLINLMKHCRTASTLAKCKDIQQMASSLPVND